MQVTKAADGRYVVKIDASSLSKAGCMRRFYNIVALGLTTPSVGCELEYGNAFHKFVETLAVTGDQVESLRIARDYYTDKAEKLDIKRTKQWMTVEHLTLTCLGYVVKYGAKGERLDFERLRDPNTNHLLVEANFAIPFYEDELGIVLLCGTMDEVGKFREGCYAIGDYKTTGVHDKQAFLSKFALSSQLIIYAYVIRMLGDMFPDSLFAAMEGKRLGCFVEGVFLSSSKPVEFQRSEVFFYTDDIIEECVTEMHAYAAALLIYIDANKLPGRAGILTGQCETLYGGKCQFFDACAAPDEIAYNHIINNSFTTKDYNPLEFRK